MVYSLATEIMDQTLITPNPLKAPDYLGLINPEPDMVLLGEKTPKEALDAAGKAVEKLAKNNQ